MTLLRSRFVTRTRKASINDLKKPCACKICGEIGHTHEEDQEECPHCEESHPAEECPTRQVTCFLCEGTTHYPAQCNLYPMVHKVIQQHKEGMKEALRKQIEVLMMKGDVKDPLEETSNPVCTKSCYSCGEGHNSQNCTKK